METDPIYAVQRYHGTMATLRKTESVAEPQPADPFPAPMPPHPAAPRPTNEITFNNPFFNSTSVSREIYQNSTIINTSQLALSDITVPINPHTEIRERNFAVVTYPGEKNPRIITSIGGTFFNLDSKGTKPNVVYTREALTEPTKQNEALKHMLIFKVREKNK